MDYYFYVVYFQVLFHLRNAFDNASSMEYRAILLRRDPKHAFYYQAW